MLSEARFDEIYIACGYTDLRYGIDGLATTVKETFGLNPSGAGKRVILRLCTNAHGLPWTMSLWSRGRRMN